MRKLAGTLGTCALPLVLAASLAPGCSTSVDPAVPPIVPADDGGEMPADPDLAVPFEAASASSYVAKVKALLTGLAATDAEVAAVEKDPAALAGLIDQWMALPQHRVKMLAFFQQAFQQTQ